METSRAIGQHRCAGVSCRAANHFAEVLGCSPTRERAVESHRLRRAALAANRQHHVSKELLQKLERELDLEEARLG